MHFSKYLASLNVVKFLFLFLLLHIPIYIFLLHIPTLSVQVGESLGQKLNSGSFHNQKSKKIFLYMQQKGPRPLITQHMF